MFILRTHELYHLYLHVIGIKKKKTYLRLIDPKG